MGNTSSIPAFFILSLVPKHCPNLLAPLCGAAIKESQGIEQHCHSEPVLFPGVGISIELQATHRHTGCSILPFSGVHPREVVLLSGRLPRQCALLYRNDWKFGFGMTRSDDALNYNLLHHRTIPSGSGKERPQTRFVTICQRRLAAKFQFACVLMTKREYVGIVNFSCVYGLFTGNW